MAVLAYCIGIGKDSKFEPRFFLIPGNFISILNIARSSESFFFAASLAVCHIVLIVV